MFKARKGFIITFLVVLFGGLAYAAPPIGKSVIIPKYPIPDGGVPKCGKAVTEGVEVRQFGEASGTPTKVCICMSDGVPKATDGGFPAVDSGTGNVPAYIDAGPTMFWCSQSQQGTEMLCDGGNGISPLYCP